MQTVSITDLYDLLSQKLGKVEAKTLVDFVETKIDKTLADKTAFHATKEDVALLKEDIARAKSEMIKWAFVFWVETVKYFV